MNNIYSINVESNIDYGIFPNNKKHLEKAVSFSFLSAISLILFLLFRGQYFRNNIFTLIQENTADNSR